ncbi:hypothetical protein LCGC14_2114860 [marine sediment metagenome]|uniref:Uncharacterized protein n=1 Tax=marine sediment metagenome TaxID=412755 RepID=A0A0F9ET45_9ZZZZ
MKEKSQTIQCVVCDRDKPLEKIPYTGRFCNKIGMFSAGHIDCMVLLDDIYLKLKNMPKLRSLVKQMIDIIERSE